MSSKAKTTATKEAATPALLPKLRFPEFRGAEGWQREQLKDTLSSISNGLALEQSGTTSGYRVTRIETISAGTIDMAKVGLIQTPEDISDYKLSVGEILLSNINSVSHVGKSVFVDRDYDLYHGMNLLRLQVNRSQHDPKFIFYFINTDEVRASLRERANKAVNQASINQTELGKTNVVLPLIREQQKIAECLSSVDELIAAQARKLDALKTHKKGLMQQLFPLEGETQPRLRFPEFQNAGDWEEEELGSKAKKVGSGITPTGGDKTYKQSGRPFVRSQNVGWGALLLDDIAFIDEEIHGSFSGTEIQVLDVLLNITGASIGRSAIADERIVGGNVNQHVCIIRVKSAELNPFYLSQYLISSGGQKQIDSFQAGGNRQGLNFAQIRSFSIPLPPKLPEQQRIADCLSALDDLIAAQTQTIEALKTHKQGLMQQLFPSPEALDA